MYYYLQKLQQLQLKPNPFLKSTPKGKTTKDTQIRENYTGPMHSKHTQTQFYFQVEQPLVRENLNQSLYDVSSKS